MAKLIVDPRDVYYIAKNGNTTTEYVLQTYLSEILFTDKIPRFFIKDAKTPLIPKMDSDFDERWENDQILLAAFLKGWNYKGTTYVRDVLYNYKTDEDFWLQYNKKMPDLIRKLRTNTTFF